MSATSPLPPLPESVARQAVTIEMMLDIVPKAVRDYLQEALQEALRPLLQSVAALEARPVLRYTGIHEPGRQYASGELVTSDGSLWHCQRPTTARPGDGGDTWQLVAKRGRDGKDMR